MELTAPLASSDIEEIEGGNPQNLFYVASFLELPRDLQLDGWVSWVDELPALGVPSYARLDVRLGWRPRADLRLDLIGRDLLEERHLEFMSSFIGEHSTFVQHRVALYLAWQH